MLANQLLQFAIKKIAQLSERVNKNEDNRFAIDAGHAAVADTIPVLPVFYKVGYGAGEGANRAFDQMVAIRTATRTIILVAEPTAQMAKPLRKKFAAHFDQMLPGENGVMPEAKTKEPAGGQPAQATLF